MVDFTDEEWNRMNLRTVNDLIDYNVVSSRYYKGANVGNNSYFEVSMYAPIYAGLQSTTGVSGGLIFRKSAYELLAAKVGIMVLFLIHLINTRMMLRMKDKFSQILMLFIKFWVMSTTIMLHSKKQCFKNVLLKKIS